MKCFVILSFCVAISIENVLKDPAEGYKDSDRYFYFVGDDDGIVHLVDTIQPINQALLRQLLRNSVNLYWLYSSSNPITPQSLSFEDTTSIVRSNFKFKNPTVFLVHGWGAKGDSEMNHVLVDAFLKNGDVNVIVLEWSSVANQGYMTAKAGVPKVGKDLGEFINWLTTLGVSYDKVHLVGYSLGGHLVGCAGRATGGKVARITALDPAGPLWAQDINRIVKTDAQYVEVIHTNTFLFGFYDPCGDVDHYPNGGSRMPGCFLSTCSHSKAYQYMAATVRYNHIFANECKTLSDMTRNTCSGPLKLMGNSDLIKFRKGIFRANTQADYPF